MARVQFSKVSLAFGDRDILLDVSLNLASGSKAALAGANGAGKSTLMKVIAGIIQPDSGDRAISKGCRISYLPQSGIVHRGRTLLEEAETAYNSIVSLIDRADELGRELEKSINVPEDRVRTAALLDEHHDLLSRVENSGFYRREAKINQVLSGLGFTPRDFNREAGEFSGGWQMRIALAKILLESPDIMLLDEPTNYLDIEARAWLESWLKSFSGGCLLVSHDRYFLDSYVNEVYEIFQGNLRRYAGNYSTYERTREAELESLVKRYNAQQEEIEKTEALIRRFRYKASKAAFAQDLIKRLERMERIEIPENLKKMSISFPPPPHSGRTALVLDNISKAYGPRQVLSGLDLNIDAGEKLLVAGPNGAGKTTLLRIIAGEDSSFEGSITYGTGITAAYFSQEAADRLSYDNLSDSLTVESFIEAEAPSHLFPRLRSMLGAFLFSGDDVFKPVSVLSGGEKSRLSLLRMLLKPVNLLILDEPTNHLDLQSKDILLNCLKSFKGTIIFVSHDRAFMEALSTKTLELSLGSSAQESSVSGRHRLFYGNYAYYLDRIEREAKLGAVQDDKLKPEHVVSTVSKQQRFNAAEYRELEKQRQTVIRRLERREAEIIKAMEELEIIKGQLENELAHPDVYSSGEKARAVKQKLDQIAAALDEKAGEWEALAEELEKAQKICYNEEHD